jgi:hypothetical protein
MSSNVAVSFNMTVNLKHFLGAFLLLIGMLLCFMIAVEVIIQRRHFAAILPITLFIVYLTAFIKLNILQGPR